MTYENYGTLKFFLNITNRIRTTNNFNKLKFIKLN